MSEARNEGSLRRLVRRFHLRMLKRFLCSEMMRMNTDTIGFRVTLRDGTLAEWHIKLIRVSEPNVHAQGRELASVPCRVLLAIQSIHASTRLMCPREPHHGQFDLLWCCP